MKKRSLLKQRNPILYLLDIWTRKIKRQVEYHTDNKILLLKEYIQDHLKDECGTWENSHTPYITSIISNLNEVESEEFSLVILDWDNSLLYELADPIIFCENKYIDDEFLYIKIFSKITDIEELDYLVENIITGIPYISTSKINSWELDFIVCLKEKVLQTMEGKDDYWKGNLKPVVEFLDHKIIERKNNNN